MKSYHKGLLFGKKNRFLNVMLILGTTDLFVISCSLSTEKDN